MNPVKNLKSGPVRNSQTEQLRSLQDYDTKAANF